MKKLCTCLFVALWACSGPTVNQPAPAALPQNAAPAAESGAEPGAEADDDAMGALRATDEDGDGAGQSPPEIRVGTADAQTGISRQNIAERIREKLPQIKYCYEKQLVVDPDLEGKLLVEFVIAPEGSIAQASASHTDLDDEVARCAEKVIATLQFPERPGGGDVTVRYPFVFKSAGDGESEQAAEAAPEAKEAADPDQKPKPADK